MIGRLDGVILEKIPPALLLLRVGGIGYEVDLPIRSWLDLPILGEEVRLFTHFVVREDAQQLYGFLTQAERDVFRQLLKISSVGPKVALAVLSGLSVDAFVTAISTADTAMLARAPGVGKKTAERIVLELSGKLAVNLTESSSTNAPSTVGPRPQILQALVALGYQPREAEAALKQLPQAVSVESGIRQALKHLSRL